MCFSSVYSEQKPKKRLPLAIAYKADPTGVVVTKSPHGDDVLEDSGVFITQVHREMFDCYKQVMYVLVRLKMMVLLHQSRIHMMKVTLPSFPLKRSSKRN